MNICFVQKGAFPYFGVMELAGFLLLHGHTPDVVIDDLEEELLAAVAKRSPGLIGISCMSTEAGWLEETASRLSAAFPGTPLVVGGVHAMLYPETIMKLDGVRFVCTGDGEETLPALIEAIEGRREVRNVPGLGYREATGEIRFTPRAQLYQQIDASLANRDIYYSCYPNLAADELKQFSSSRGCPFACAFCFNSQLRSLTRGLGAYVRRKSPERFAEEIESTLAKYGARTLFFADDLFLTDKPWLRRFLALYREKINVPFMCSVRADAVDDEIAQMLAEAGCSTITFGLETGNEQLRKSILKKTVTDEHIRRCSDALRRHGIKIQTSNMFCIPGETFEDALKTIRLNIEIKVNFAFCTIFMPFPGTPLADYCIEQGLLDKSFSLKDLPKSFLTHSILGIKDKKRLQSLQRCAYFMIRYPALYGPLAFLVRHFGNSGVFYPLLFLGTFLRYREERGISFWATVRFLWRFRSSF
jgi:radical SAM superfamily enzyme YgiQ (UPF0313 family)